MEGINYWGICFIGFIFVLICGTLIYCEITELKENWRD